MSRISDITEVYTTPSLRPACTQRSWALVLGGASSVWDDIANALKFTPEGWPGLVLAVNDIGCHWPGEIDHWCTLHAIKFAEWLPLRARNGYSPAYKTWTRLRYPENADYKLQQWASGSSGLFGAQVAITLGCTKVVLCGIPMTVSPHFAESKEHRIDKPWTDAGLHIEAWKRSRGRLGDRVRSMSGWTQSEYGTVTPEWLSGT